MSIVSPEAIDYLIQIEPVFENIQKIYGNPPNWEREASFSTLIHFILEQQVSLASAKAHFERLKAFVPLFTPAELLKLTDEEMRYYQISRQKMTYIRALSKAIENQDLVIEDLSKYSIEEVRKTLTHIKGIGNWTADVYLLFCLQSPDIFPIGDVAIVNTMKFFFQHTTQSEMLLYAEKWRPYRSLATYFLWHHYLSNRKRST